MKFSDGSEFKLLSLKDGNVILSGTIAPSNSLGRAGDYYINNTDWTIYGPKTTVWGSPTSLKGEDGDDGINGNMWYTGAAVPSNLTYNDGDFFLRTDGLLYQKVSGTWSYITTLKGSNGNDGIGTAESVGALVNTLTTKSTPTDSDLWTLRDEVSGLWRKINTTQLLAFLETNFDLKYEPINSVVVNYYVTNLTELISAWTDAQTKTLPTKIYANGIMNLTANVTLGGTREIPIEGIPNVRFNLNGYELDIYRPHLTSVGFFSPNTNGYIKARNGYTTLNRVFFGQDNYSYQEEGTNLLNIPHILIVGAYTSNTGGININGITHQTSLPYINENPNVIIQPIWIKDTSGQSGQRLFVDIKGVSIGRSFDRFAKVLITADNPNLIVLVGGDNSWYYDDIQPQPGLGLNPLSTLKPITSVHELRLNDFEEIEDVADEDRVLIQQGNKVVLAPKTSVGGATNYADLTSKPSINSVELSGNKTASQLGLEPAKSSDSNYVTDAEKAALHSHSNKEALDNVSGVNTGDQDLSGLAPINHTHSYEPVNPNIQQHISSTTNPHSTTKSQVGLGNVDNTSDLNKPISTAQQAALDLKAMQNPGICQKIPILPQDIVIDPVANTLTIATVNGGQTISISNPIRFFTDGAGIITKWEKTAPVVFNFTNTNGVWYFHFNNSGNPVATQTPWNDFNTIATVYRFYLNDQLPDATKITVRAWECHLNDTSASDHAWKHAQGTQYINGFDSVSNILTIANGIPTTAPNADGRNTVVAMTGGNNTDDGLEYTVVNSTTNAKFNQDLGQTIAANLNATNSGLFKIRTNDAAGRLSFLAATRFPFAWDVATNAPQFITASGVRTLVPDNNWFVYYSYALQDDVQGEAIKLVSAESAFTTYTAAQSHSWKTLQNLYSTLKDKEIRLLYKYIFYCDKTGGRAYNVGCKYTALVSVEDQRTQLLTSTSVSGGAGSVIASNVIEITDGNVQAALDGLRNAVANINPTIEMIISKSTYNSIAEPGIYKNGAIAKQIIGHRLSTNATDFSITVAGTTYTKTATYPIALAANAEMTINDVSIQTGYNIGNVILIIQ